MIDVLSAISVSHNKLPALIDINNSELLQTPGECPVKNSVIVLGRKIGTNGVPKAFSSDVLLHLLL